MGNKALREYVSLLEIKREIILKKKIANMVVKVLQL